MDFKEWLLTEMPHLSIQGCLNDNICAFDLRFEDWKMDSGRHLDGGTPKDFNPLLPFTLKLNDNWLTCDRMGEPLKIQKKKPSGYQEVPDGWEKYAEFYGPDLEIIKPALYGAVERLKQSRLSY